MVYNMIDKNKIIRRPRRKLISIRISYDLDRWLKKNNYSPTAILHEACRELGYRGR